MNCPSARQVWEAVLATQGGEFKIVVIYREISRDGFFEVLHCFGCRLLLTGKVEFRTKGGKTYEAAGVGCGQLTAGRRMA
jgi:hypothetical protein